MNRPPAWISLTLVTALAVLPGCLLRDREGWFHDESVAHFNAVATELEAPNVESSSSPDTLGALAPLTIRNDQPTEYWELSLEETVQTAISNSQVLRDLGGAVIRSPGAIETVYSPAVVDTDPRFGVDAALSAFDAQFNVLTDFANNDRALNNELLGGGTRLLKQETFNVQTELLKRSATGGEFAVRKNIGYDANNAPSNLFPHAYNANVEFEARQPLLQGAGSLFNRIAGAEVNGRNRNLSRFPGDYNGVLIARINTDVQLTDLEMGLRDLVSNVENTYWDLYYAYRDLDAKIAARDAALETWRRVHALFEANRRGGEAEKEAQAREQYFQFQEEVENALTGRLLDGTRTNNGSRGGTFRGTGGVHVVERRLRLLMGISLSDGRLIRPSNEPTLARVAFDWPELVTESLCRREELRRQKWIIKRRELELVASRNFLMPRMDAFGQYRFRGFGESLIDNNTGGNQRFDNAFQDLTTGDFQEWQLGVELSVPIGFRQGHAGVRNAELLLSRERAVLKEQERQIIHDLADIVAEMERSYAVAQTAYNRRLAAQEQLKAVQAAYDADKSPLDQVLSAQRRVADSDERYHRALVEYAISIKNIHFEKGSLLDHNQVFLSEGPWPGKAYFDAARRERWRGKEKPMNFALRMTPPVSNGAVTQEAIPHSAEMEFASEEVLHESEIGANGLPLGAWPTEIDTPVMESIPGSREPGSILRGPIHRGEEVLPQEELDTPFKDDPLAPPGELPAQPNLDSLFPPGASTQSNRVSSVAFTSEVVEEPTLTGGVQLPRFARPEQPSLNPPDPQNLSSFAPFKKVREVFQETLSTVAVMPGEEPVASPEAGTSGQGPVARMILRVLPESTSEAAPSEARSAAGLDAGSDRLAWPAGAPATASSRQGAISSAASSAGGKSGLQLSPTARGVSEKPTNLRR